VYLFAPIILILNRLTILRFDLDKRGFLSLNNCVADFFPGAFHAGDEVHGLLYGRGIGRGIHYIQTIDCKYYCPALTVRYGVKYLCADFVALQIFVHFVCYRIVILSAICINDKAYQHAL